MTTSPKPSWDAVPDAVKASLRSHLGAAITQARLQTGGYTASATFTLELADGRAVFAKGLHPGLSATSAGFFCTEAGHYQTLPILSRFGPRYLGLVEAADWQVLLLENIAGPPVLPWTPATLKRVLERLAAFHRAGLEAPFPDSVPPVHEEPFAGGLFRGEMGWQALAARADGGGDRLAALFVDPRAATHWLERALPALIMAERQAMCLGGPRTLLHQDVRSDNIALRADGTPVFLDWPFLAVGPALFDVMGFFPSAALESGLRVEHMLDAYERAFDHRFAAADVAIAATLIAGYFADAASRPPTPGLRAGLRDAQRRQMAAMLELAARALELTPPPPARP